MRWGNILVLFLGILIGWAGMYLFYENHYGKLLKECNETLYEQRGDDVPCS